MNRYALINKTQQDLQRLKKYINGNLEIVI